MSANPSPESPGFGKPPRTGAVEDVYPPAYDAADVEAATSQAPTSPESQPVSRVETYFLAIPYTAALAIATLTFCWMGALTLGFASDEQPAVFARVTYATLLGSSILGPIYFTNRRFMAFAKARIEDVSTTIANGEICAGWGYLFLLYLCVTGVVASAATVGYALIFWPLVYPESSSTLGLLGDALLIPFACCLGGLRWMWEMFNLTVWVMIRIPEISPGLDRETIVKLIKLGIVFTACGVLIGNGVSPWPFLVLSLPPSLVDKCVAYFDKHREPDVEAAGPRA